MDDDIQIRNDIPLPPTATQRRYPFDKLEVGQMFFVPHMKSSNFSASRRSAEKNTGFKFETRTLTVDGVRGVGVWRTE